MDPFPNLDRAYAMVVQEETHRGISHSRDPPAAVGFHAQAKRSAPIPAASSSGLGVAPIINPDRTPSGRPWCTFCSRVGHTQEHCYKRQGIHLGGRGQGHVRRQSPASIATLGQPAAHAVQSPQITGLLPLPEAFSATSLAAPDPPAAAPTAPGFTSDQVRRLLACSKGHLPAHPHSSVITLTLVSLG